MIRKLAIGLVAASAAAAVILPGPVADMLGVGEPLMMRASGLVLFAFGFLALAALPEFITAIMFFLAAMVLQVSTPAVIFSGFASTAWWLVFGGLVAGIAIDVTGLGRRLARAASGRLTHSYGGAVNGVVLVAVILAFLMPSTMGRVVLLMPIVLALADRLGLVAGRPGRTGLVMAATLGTYVPSTAILPANVPNTVLLGAADALYGIKLNYGPYLLQHFPIMGLAYVLILVPVILRLFPDRLDPAPPESSATPISGDERKLAIILGASLAAFSLDFVHGISPAWVSLAAGLACLLPGIGLVSPKMFAERMNLGVLLYVAGIIGVGALISDSGIGVRLGAALVDLARPVPGEDVRNFIYLLGLSIVIGLATTMVAQPAVLTPMAAGLAEATGFPLLTVLMIQVLGFAVLLFPYQSPPTVVAMQLGRVAWRDGTKACLIMGIVTMAILMPLAYGWWRVLD